MALLEVKTESGMVRGTRGGNQGVSVFKGIPFAAPPVGDLRWREPQPVQPWQGVLEAYEYKPNAMQRPQEKGSFYQKEFYPIPNACSEDCLYLNVWTPALKTDERLPVAVWLHGGGFQMGCGYGLAFDGEAFAKRGVILVTLTYRLNIFGFLAHRDLMAESTHGTTGNYGLLDMIAAIEWVKRNIEAFGGDSDDMTLLGQSAGGRATYLLAASPLTRGYFRHAVIQSGAGLSVKQETSYLDLDTALTRGKAWMATANIPSIEAGREMDAKKLLELSALGRTLFDDRSAFRPTVDGYVFPDDPNRMVLEGKGHDIDYMIGCTAQECDPPRHPYTEDLVAYRKKAEHIYGKHADRFLQLAHGDSVEGIVKTQKIAFFEEDLAGCFSFCENQLRLGRRPAFQYFFMQVPPGSDPGIGSYHSSEHFYVFQTLSRSWRPFSGRDFDLSNRMCGYWTQFIKSGIPNFDGAPQWTPYTREHPEAMALCTDGGMMEVPQNPMVQFEIDFYLGRLEK